LYNARTALRIAVGLALALPLPALILPFWRDDFLHQLLIRIWLGKEVPGDLFPRLSVDQLGFVNLFGFIDNARLGELIARGDLPWWAPADTHVMFWRPLSSLTHVLDHLLWGLQPAFHRLHSILWYAALIVAVGLLYRRQLSAALFPLALLLFTIEEAHWGPVCFVANRNALVGGVLGLLALLCHVRRREEGSEWGGPLSALLFALALMGGESALGAFAYLAAYELFVPRRSTGKRLIALLPPVALVSIWAVCYRLGEYGARGVEIYIDPTRDPLRYLGVAVERFLVLICSQLTGVIAELSLGAPAFKYPQVALGLTAALLAAFILHRRWPELDPTDRRTLRWLIPGALLSLLPVMATYPMDRLLLLPSVGGAVVVAIVIRHVWSDLRSWKTISGSKRWLSAILSPLLLTQVAIPIVVWLGFPIIIYGYHHRLNRKLSPAVLARGDIGQCRVFVIGAPDLSELWFQSARRILAGVKEPGAWQVLSESLLPQRLHRDAERSLEIAYAKGRPTHPTSLRIFPPPHLRYTTGDAIELKGLRIRILEADREGLRRVAFEFDRSLEDDRMIFLVWHDDGLEPLSLPGPGRSVDLFGGGGAAPGRAL
jgi:hypothetical protein